LPSPAQKSQKDWIEALLWAAGQLPEGDDLAHVYYEEREDLRIGVELDGPVDVLPSRQHGICVRAGGARPRSAFLSAPEPADVADLVARTLGRRIARARLARSQRRTDPPSPLSPALDAARGLIERARQSLPGIEASVKATWVAFRQGIRVALPGPVLREDERRGARVRLDIVAAGASGAVTATGERALRFPGHDSPMDDLADEVVKRLRQRREAIPTSPGETPVVFAPGTGGILIHELVGHALEADTVLRRGSSLAASGELGSEEITVVDDPRRGRGAWRWDDEGVEARAVSLIERGRVVGFVSDLTTARRGSFPASGHGRRSSYRERVLPRMGCTFLTPGSRTRDEVVSATDRGVLVRRMEAAMVDPIAGRAIFRVTDADTIVDGRADTPLLPFMLEVDLVSGLSSIDLVADDLEFDRCMGSCLRDGQPLTTSVGAPTYRTRVATVVL
jgi:predicted Zn-dependent protease